jgi:hypothetical protein
MGPGIAHESSGLLVIVAVTKSTGPVLESSHGSKDSHTQKPRVQYCISVKSIASQCERFQKLLFTGYGLLRVDILSCFLGDSENFLIAIPKAILEGLYHPGPFGPSPGVPLLYSQTWEGKAVGKIPETFHYPLPILCPLQHACPHTAANIVGINIPVRSGRLWERMLPAWTLMRPWCPWRKEDRPDGGGGWESISTVLQYLRAPLATRELLHSITTMIWGPKHRKCQ